MATNTIVSKYNTIVSKYNTLFTDAQKLAFWNDFQHIDDPAFWKLLNSGKNTSNVLDGSYIVNRLNLSERGLAEAKFTDYICVQKRANAIISFVDEPSLKPILGTLSYERKLKFLDTFGDQVAKFVDEPQLINKWKRYYDDGLLRPNLNSLNKTRQIELFERYGSFEEIYLRIKNNPDIILSFDMYSQRPELISNIKLYSSSVKDEIIFFERFGSKNEEWFNIFKNDPLEIAYEINICDERLVKTLNNFRYEKLILRDEILFNILTDTGINSTWPNGCKIYGGELRFDFNTSLLKQNGYNVKGLGQKWVDDTFEIFDDKITSIKVEWTENINYPSGESLGFKEFNSVYENTYDEIEAVKATTFYKTMSSRKFTNIKDILIDPGHITVILTK